jgi:hypothetical protein
MSDEKKKEPTWEKDPAEFILNLPNDPVWANRERKEKELRQKLGLGDEPQLKNYPDVDTWREAFRKDQRLFQRVTGYKERKDALLALYWSGAFDVKLLPDTDHTNCLLAVSQDLNYLYGEATLEGVVAEWKRRNSN